MKGFKYKSIWLMATMILLPFAFVLAQSSAEKGSGAQVASVGDQLTAASMNIPLGTLPAGENVIIEFNVDVAGAIPNGVTEISNQATISGDNFTSVLTDDPDVGGATDPTVTPIKALDLGVIALNAPGADCGLTDSETVTITIYNYASVAQSNFDVSFNITGPVNSSATETVTQTVPASGGTLMYTFSATADLSVPGTYAVTATTLLSGDTQPGNDAFNTNVVSSPPVFADAGPDQFMTEFQSLQLGGSPTASSGTPPFTYSWTPTTGLDDPSIANPTATLNAPATYTVLVTDNAGCSASDMVSIDYIDLCIVINIAIDGIDDILNTQSLSYWARMLLQAAKADLNMALYYLDNDDWDNAAVALESAWDKCEYAENFGADLTDLINDILEPTHLLAQLTLQVAQPLVGSNPQLQSAIQYAQNKLAQGEYDQNQNDFAEAVRNYLYSYGGSRFVIENGGGGTSASSESSMLAKTTKENMPSHITEIVVNVEKNGVYVNWASVSENNNEGFFVYRAEISNEKTMKVKSRQMNDLPTSTSKFKKVSKGIIKGKGNSVKRSDYQFFDRDVEAGVTYFYKVVQQKKGKRNYEGEHGTVSGVVNTAPVKTESGQTIAESELPTDFSLEQNYPNPFNPETTIAFALPEESDVTLAIYNTNGKRVRTLVAGSMPGGRHNITWDARDDTGGRVSSGIYLYRIVAGDFVASRKLILMK